MSIFVSETIPAFLFFIDPKNGNLCSILSKLASIQNAILTRLFPKKAENLIGFDSNAEIPPHTAHSGDILILNKKYLENLLMWESFNNATYGKHSLIYHCEEMQMMIAKKLVQCKLLRTEVFYYKTITFLGETFTKNSNYEYLILQLKKSGFAKPLHNQNDLNERLRTMQIQSPENYLQNLNIALGYLTKVLVNLQIKPENRMSISNYAAKNKMFFAYPSFLSEPPWKECDIKCSVSIYELLEEKIFVKFIPNFQKKERQMLQNDEKENLRNFICEIENFPGNSNAADEILNTFRRIILRVLSQSNNFEGTKIHELLFLREDCWGFPKNNKLFEKSRQLFPLLGIEKSCSCYLLMEEEIRKKKKMESSSQIQRERKISERIVRKKKSNEGAKMRFKKILINA